MEGSSIMLLWLVWVIEDSEQLGQRRRKGMLTQWLQLLLGRSPNKPLTTLTNIPNISQAFRPASEPLQSSSRPTKSTRSTTKGLHSKLDSYTTSPHRQLQSKHKCQSGKEFFGKEAYGVHSHPDVVCRLATLFDRKPNGGVIPWEDFPVSFPSMVQPQRNLRLSCWCPGTLDKIVSYPNFVRGPLFDGLQPLLDRFEVLNSHC